MRLSYLHARTLSPTFSIDMKILLIVQHLAAIGLGDVDGDRYGFQLIVTELIRDF